MSERRPPWAWLFFLQLALVVLASALATTGRLPAGALRPPADKLGHLLMFGALSFLGVAFFGHARRLRVVLVLLIGAALEELSQRALPARSFHLGDLAMNVAGILGFGAAAAAVVRSRAAARRPQAEASVPLGAPE